MWEILKYSILISYFVGECWHLNLCLLVPTESHYVKQKDNYSLFNSGLLVNVFSWFSQKCEGRHWLFSYNVISRIFAACCIVIWYKYYSSMGISCVRTFTSRISKESREPCLQTSTHTLSLWSVLSKFYHEHLWR